MIQPSDLRIGQKVKWYYNNSILSEWTISELHTDYLYIKLEGLAVQTVNYDDLELSDIVPTEYDKAVEALLVLVAECIDDEHIDKDAEGMESDLKKAMEMVDKLRPYDVTETLQKASEAK
jgi:hypothetical protein